MLTCGSQDAFEGRTSCPKVSLGQRKFLRTHSIESIVQFLLDLQTIVKDYKNIFIQKIGSKNDNSSKASLSQLSLCGTTLKKSPAGSLTAAAGNQVVTGKVESMLIAAAT